MLARKYLPFALSLLLAPLAAQADTPSYSVTLVGPAHSTAAALNDHGQVTGEFQDPNSVAHFAFLANGNFVNLGPPGGSSAGLAINNGGTVVGNASGSPFNFGTAFVDRPGVPIQLFNPFGGINSQARGINDAGQIVGWGDANRSFLVSGTTVTDLGSLGGTFSEANAINNRGEIVGLSSLKDENIVHGYLYINGKLTDLGTLGGNFSDATGINDAGTVVGFSRYDPLSENFHAFIYSSGVMTDLGTLNGGQSEALGVNNLGQVVGRSYGSVFSERRGFLFTGGALTDLNSLIDPASGWTILDGADINNKGQIAAVAVKDGIEYAVRLDLASPVPEPARAAMLLAGLGLLGLTAARKAAARAA